MSAAFLARMATEIEQVRYFKIETPGAATKLRELIRLGGARSKGRGTARKASPCLPTSTPAPPGR
jgi:4-hydroxy-tetrahydrodipicolinate synthase/2-keto-3-deoxy-L-arabinonate dehydratase